MRSVLALMAMAATTLPVLAEPVMLKWQLAKGDTFYTRTKTINTGTVEVAGMSMDISQDQTIVTKYTVQERSDARTVIEQTIVKAEMTGNTPGLEGIADKMKGATLTFTLDGDLKVTKVEGYDKYIEQISGGDDNTAKMMRTQFSEEALKAGMDETFAAIPGKAVEKGDTWKRSTKLPLGPLGEFSVSSEYTYDGMMGDAAKINFTADLSFAAKGGDDSLPFKISKGELKADDFTGNVFFDPKAGRITKSDSATKIGGTLTISAGGAELDMVVKLDVKTNTVMSSKNPSDD